jgi:hypothetical protein
VAARHQAAVQQRTHQVGAKVGFKFSYFGVFWLDLWTWDGEYCLFHDKEYWPVPKATAAALLDRPEEELTPPLAYTYPSLLLILAACLALFLVGCVIESFRAGRESRLLADERYKQASDVLKARLGLTPPPPLADAPPGTPPPPRPQRTPETEREAREAAQDCLTSQGVPPDEAERNVRFLFSRLPQPPPQA